MNKNFIVSFLCLLLFCNAKTQAENSFKTYFGKVYSIGDTITLSSRLRHIYEFKNNTITSIKNNLEGKKIVISQFHDITNLDIKQMLILAITEANHEGWVIAKGDQKSYLIDLDNALFDGNIMLNYKKSYFKNATDLTADILFAYKIKIYNIDITDDIIEKYIILSITNEEYQKYKSDPFIMPEIRERYKKKLNETLNNIDFNQVFRVKCKTNVKQYDIEKKAFPIHKMEFVNRTLKYDWLNEIGYCTFGEAAFTFKNAIDFLYINCLPETAKFLYSIARYKNYYTLNENTVFISYVYFKIHNKKINTHKLLNTDQDLVNIYPETINFCIDADIQKIDLYYSKQTDKDTPEVTNFYVGSTPQETIQ